MLQFPVNSASISNMPRPICFMVMPYRTKETGAKPPPPSNVNFDTLWEK